MSAAFLVARDLAKSYGSRVVVDGVSLIAGAGRRVGLVGDNGTGKTTLLRLLAGLDDPDAGEVVRPDDLGFLHQHRFRCRTTRGSAAKRTRFCPEEGPADAVR